MQRLLIIVSIAMTACASTVERQTTNGGITVTDRTPAAVYASDAQMAYSRGQTDAACAGLEMMRIADIPKDIANYDQAVNSVAWGNAAIARECGLARTTIAEQTRPSDYLKYSLESRKLWGGLVLKGVGLAATISCMFRWFGACEGTGSSAGDHFENVTINQSGVLTAGSGGTGGEMGAAGPGGGLTGGDQVINLGGYGNVINSTLSGSVSGLGRDSFLGSPDLDFGSLNDIGF